MDYDLLAEVYARHRRVHPGVLRSLIEQSGIGPQSRVLEVGCGTGSYVAAIAATVGCACWGVDPSAEMLGRAAAQSSSVAFSQGCAEALGLPSGQLDLVFSVDVIHHVADRAAYHGEAHRVLRPGGLLCTVTDSEDIIRRRVPMSAYFPETVAPELARYPRMAELRTLMAAAGFADVRDDEVECHYLLTDAGPYRDRAYSALYLISDEAYRRGLAWMERDLAVGPVPCVARYALLWGRALPDAQHRRVHE